MSSLDERIKLWINGVPYIWTSDEKTFAMRYYHVKPDTTVYDENGKETKMYMIESLMRQGNFDKMSPVYLFKFGDSVSDMTKNLFRVYNPYFELVDVSKLNEKKIIRINGKPIDVNDGFIPLLKKSELIHLRYLRDIPPINKHSVIFEKK